MTNYRTETIMLGGTEFSIAVDADLTPDLWIADPVGGTNEFHLRVIDPDGWFEADVRESGCVHLYRYHNTPCTQGREEAHPQLIDYIHICDVDDMINRLQALKRAATAHFGEGWT